MFTGIIEDLGDIKDLKRIRKIHYLVKCNFTDELKVDQSVAHNGVCLTVISINNTEYTVTAIEENLKKTCIRNLKIKDKINLERGMKLGERPRWTYCTRPCRPNWNMYSYFRKQRKLGIYI